MIFLCDHYLVERLKNAFDPKRGTSPSEAMYPAVQADEQDWKLVVKAAAMFPQRFEDGHKTIDTQKAGCPHPNGGAAFSRILELGELTVGLFFILYAAKHCISIFQRSLDPAGTIQVQRSLTASKRPELGSRHRNSLLLLSFVDFIEFRFCDATASSLAKSDYF